LIWLIGERCSCTHKLFILKYVYFSFTYFIFDSKCLFFAHVYEFSVILVALSGISELKNRIIYFYCCNVLSDPDIVEWPRSIILFHSMHALFLCENFQTNLLQGKSEGRSSIFISSFDWVCLKIDNFHGISWSSLSRSAVRNILSSRNLSLISIHGLDLLLSRKKHQYSCTCELFQTKMITLPTANVWLISLL